MSDRDDGLPDLGQWDPSYRALFAVEGLSYGAMHAYSLIANHRPRHDQTKAYMSNVAVVRLQSIADTMRTDKSRVSRWVTELEKRSLIEVRRSANGQGRPSEYVILDPSGWITEAPAKPAVDKAAINSVGFVVKNATNPESFVVETTSNLLPKTQLPIAETTSNLLPKRQHLIRSSSEISHKGRDGDGAANAVPPPSLAPDRESHEGSGKQTAATTPKPPVKAAKRPHKARETDALAVAVAKAWADLYDAEKRVAVSVPAAKQAEDLAEWARLNAERADTDPLVLARAAIRTYLRIPRRDNRYILKWCAESAPSTALDERLGAILDEERDAFEAKSSSQQAAAAQTTFTEMSA